MNKQSILKEAVSIKLHSKEKDKLSFSEKFLNIKSEIESLPDNDKALWSLYLDLEEAITKEQILIDSEDIKRKTWKIERERSKHDYSPLIFEILKILAIKNKLAKYAPIS